jgi:SNF2 family DNA or RNA helicase
VTIELLSAKARKSCFEVKDKNGASLSILAEAATRMDGWLFRLSKRDCVKGGDFRIECAGRRLLELDAALVSALAIGRTIERTVPSSPDQNSELPAVIEQVIPMLLPLKIEDHLYDYQRRGVAWLLRHDRAILGDDMGLGKTAQAIGAARRLIRYGKIKNLIVICPRTLIPNWISEVRHWAPELTIATVLPDGHSREGIWQRVIRRAHVVLTSYEQLRDPPRALIKANPELIIADEAHRLRKTDSLTTRGMRSIISSRFWALTGTPIERDMGDLAVLLSILDPARFSPDDGKLHPLSLRARFRPYLLRRHKNDVLSDLPPVLETDELIDLSDEQRISYDTAILRHSKKVNNLGYLPLFNKLRAICDVDKDTGASSKLDRIMDIIATIKSANEKAVVFSYLLDPLKLLRDRLDLQKNRDNYQILTGSMNLSQRDDAIRHFKSEKKCAVLLASTRVASEGLTLVEANHVIFINRWWNPSSNSQARDRVIRIGQTRAVNVITFTCRGTIEERINTLLKDKSITFDKIVNALNENDTENIKKLGILA